MSKTSCSSLIVCGNLHRIESWNRRQISYMVVETRGRQFSSAENWNGRTVVFTTRRKCKTTLAFDWAENLFTILSANSLLAWNWSPFISWCNVLRLPLTPLAEILILTSASAYCDPGRIPCILGVHLVAVVTTWEAIFVNFSGTCFTGACEYHARHFRRCLWQEIHYRRFGAKNPNRHDHCCWSWLQQ